MLGLLSTIKGRLTFAFVLTGVLTLSAVGTTIYLSNRSRVEFDWQAQHVAPLRAAVNEMVLVGLEGGSRLRMQVMSYDLNAAKAAALEKLFAGFDDTLARAGKLAVGEPQIQAELDAIAREWRPVRALRSGIVRAMQKGDYTGAIGLLPKDEKAWSRLRDTLQALNQRLATQRAASGDRIRQAIRHTWVWSAALLLSALVFGGGFLLFTIVGAVSRIGTLLRMMESVGEGDADLSQRLIVRGHDEMDRIAAAFNRFVERIHEAIVKVAQSATQVSGASRDLSISSEQMKAGAQRQRVDTEQVAAAINEMSATAHEVARNIEQASGLASNAEQNSRAGGQRAASAVAVVEGLQGELARTGQAVGELSQGVVDIGGIVELINQIADQTNLLALNAAIEAARAGEQGRGFAVVAEEVRALALKTQDATAKIRDMIERISRSADSAVASMSSTQTRSKSAGDEVELVAEALAEVVGMVHDIADRAAQIATAAEEQSAVAEEINRNVSSIRDAAEETESAIGQSTSAANALESLSSDLQQLVGRFKGV